MARKPWVKDHSTAAVGGCVLITLGALLLWDAYEGRGRKRPFAAKFLPGG